MHVSMYAARKIRLNSGNVHTSKNQYALENNYVLYI